MIPTRRMRLLQRRMLTSAQAMPEVSSTQRRANEFELAMVSGGDDRSVLKAETQTNKYNVSPWPTDAVFRGSCTCNPPTQRGYLAAESLYYDKIHNNKYKIETYSELAQDIRSRLARVFNLPKGTGVMLCPSGSDAEFIPVAIAQALSGQGKLIANIVTQHKEIGAGSAPAADLRYFSKLTPLAGNTQYQVGTRLLGTEDEQILPKIIPARDVDGIPITADTAQVAQQLLDENNQIDLILAHAVYGGKTGLRDEIIPSTDKILGIVDACQGRFTNSELEDWLIGAQNIVLITGSKFYRGPPFSGAVLLPPSLMTKLQNISNPPPILTALGDFLSRPDLPLPAWQSSLPAQNHNLGLALRWSAALADMETAAPYDIILAQTWAKQVTNLVTSLSDTIELFESNRCIISVRLRPHPQAPFFNTKQLRQIYDWMTTDCSKAFDQVPHLSKSQRVIAATPCAIGQPVEVTPTTGVLRLALGVDSFDAFAKKPEIALLDDQTALTKLSLLASHFDFLSSSPSSD
uniref:Aminotransferase class V domain-containing protein n=1 Tax=Aureoumbra lagunensis TaxID=44058 RepID=A0A6S8BTQ1_9STRA|mmetsp:Transcript_1957/g.2612  ORF Transcript_1957/g.2612 Transcript_1957/m.2612 type:complete len:519 (-) Transcript_1957:781-2337(-)|eukprot:CAMPEP_0197288704 /NCGR_PEP_ID=MMETSP0890-20130614/5861_1 /TAXON_ID=44058 ORGANISM="Aureoumbra lagunensis, Strain CCMP1510" /NCGR_SAMPLE_ID=MMETSP0890 /ASSEMBLY_ACC=CAM_ASM_000533 /LENGTH=518 /DNA_ID=CAMNT_0042759631 /DNA_START=16 /DNA_END=1572 /DNA_ORIENTATION=-